MVVRNHSKGWSQPLPRPLRIPQVTTLRTLADIRAFLRHVPADRRQLSSWRYVEGQLQQAAAGRLTPADVSVALQIVLMAERVPYRVG